VGKSQWRAFPGRNAKSSMRKLSEQTGNKERLLSESEWEYISRAGTTTGNIWGDRIHNSKAKYDSTDLSE